jgi:hypothetical protein
MVGMYVGQYHHTSCNIINIHVLLLLPKIGANYRISRPKRVISYLGFVSGVSVERFPTAAVQEAMDWTNRRDGPGVGDDSRQ